MPESSYPVRIMRDVRIPMRDGVHLAANLYLPAADGPCPALLQYTPYLKDGPGGRGPVETAQLFFARRGYACATLDMRGFGASDGAAAPPFSASEKRDGHDALGWLAQQPWCDGGTGMWGISYGGDTALAVASTQPPSLKAIVAIHATDDEFTGVCYPHGCRGALWADMDWGFRMLGFQLLPPLRLGEDPRWARRWQERLEHLQPHSFTWHTLPPATWAAWRTDASAIQAATYAVSAWHDCYPAETLRYYHALAAPKRLLIGPWKHEFPDRAVNQPIGFWHEMACWWDHWLKGRDTGTLNEPPVAVYQQNGEGWRYENAWPPAGIGPRDYFFHPHGRLAPSAPAEDGADTYCVDPTVGPAHLPWDWTTETSPVPLDLSPDDHRALTYTTPALEADLDIAGTPEVTVYLAADQPDFPLAVWLSDVAPNGFASLICQGWVRPAQVVGELLQPGKTYGVHVPLHPAFYRLRAGRRLRLALAGANFPVLVSPPINPLLTIHRTTQCLSVLRLPVATASSSDKLSPSFQAPHAEAPEALLLREANHDVSRDLLSRTAVYRRRLLTIHRLEGGAILRWKLRAKAVVDREAPGDVTFQATQTLTVERGVHHMVVYAEMLQTFDHFHLRADITRDGRPFYDRTWDLDMNGAEWRLKS